MAMREYRKGNWTVEETMILIEAKKKDDERRKLNRSSKQLALSTPPPTPPPPPPPPPPATTSPSSSGGSGSGKPVTELRWKWVEEYCWERGCFRSQNQCNDKWDNLMRDYKKVRDYQKYHFSTISLSNDSITNKTTTNKSYWSMDKIERKDKGLPTNMLPQIYQALFEIVEPPTTTTTTTIISTAAVSPVATTTTSFLLPPPPPTTAQHVVLPALQITPVSLSPHPLPQSQPSPVLEGGTSEQHYGKEPELSPAKRRRTEDERRGEGESESGGKMAAEEVSLAISKSATMISEAIQASEERQERRHKEMINIHQSRLRVEETNLEINRQGFHGLTDAINRLATSIFTWANSNKNQQG